MKQVLFKVWDFEGNDGKGCWIEDSKGFNAWWVDSNGEVCLGKDHPIAGKIAFCYTPGRFDILLWTGRKDKYGEDIYDGHIMGGHPHGNAVVSYDEEGACFMCGSDLEGDAAMLTNALDNCRNEWKIIGHKHTHPQLLPQTT